MIGFPTQSALSPRVLAMLVALAAWPVWGWYARRMQDGSDDPWGLLALVTLGVFMLGERHNRATQPVRTGVVCTLCVAMLGYAGAVFALPPIFRAGFVAIALAMLASTVRTGKIFDPALWALSLLSLPVIASLQFTIGYPLRALTAELAAPLVRVSGLPAVADGTLLRIGHEVVVVDGPCSGVRMLWTGAYLTATLAALLRLSTRRTLGLGMLAAVVVVIANVSRASAVLFLERFEAMSHLEPGRMPVPEFLHQGAGVVTFVIVGLGVSAAAMALAPARTTGERMSVRTPPLAQGRECKSRRDTARAGGVLALALLLAAGSPLLARHLEKQTSAEVDTSHLVFPTRFEGRELSELPLSKREKEVLGSFPGKVARFQAGANTVVMRWVTRPTRALHPAKDCYRGMGFSVRTIEPWQDAQGRVWSRFEAEHAVTGEHLVVRELITGSDDVPHADLSSWYWSAHFGRTTGPWLGMTVATPFDRAAIDGHPLDR